MADHSHGWQPGQSGNPFGRPKRGNTFADLLEKELKKRKYTIVEADGTSKRANGKQAIIRAHLAIIFSKTVAEDIRLRAIDSLMDRVDGRPKQALEHSGPGGGPMEVNAADMSPEARAAWIEHNLIRLGELLEARGWKRPDG